MTDPDELDAEIAANVEAQLRERAQRRERLRKVRAEFDRRRQAGLKARHAAKLGRRCPACGVPEHDCNPGEDT